MSTESGQRKNISLTLETFCAVREERKVWGDILSQSKIKKACEAEYREENNF